MNDDTLDALLEAAKGDGEVIYTESETNVDAVKFIDYIGLKSGEDRYSLAFIELLYREWTNEKDVYIRTVHKIIKSYIDYSVNNGVYMIDEDALNFSNEELKRMIVHAAFQFRVINDEEEKEDKKQISRIKSKESSQTSKGLHRL